MIIFNLLQNIFTNAFTYEKSKAVYYSRINIAILIISAFVSYMVINVSNISSNTGLYNGLFNIGLTSQIIGEFILILTAIILTYNGFFMYNLSNKDKDSLGIKINEADNEISKANEQKLNIALLNYNNVLSKNEYRAEPFKVMQKEKYIRSILEYAKISETYRIVEYSLVIYFVVCGGLFLMTSGDLISLFISLELQSYALYILCTLHKDSESSTWGGLVYFLLGGLSSCFIALGSSLIYINTGTTILDGFYIINNVFTIVNKESLIYGLQAINDNDISGLQPSFQIYSITDFNDGVMQTNKIQGSNFASIIEKGKEMRYFINISLVILVTGFLFKISAAPFHFWSPDVYDAIPTTVTTFVALIAKLSIFVFLAELVYYVYGNYPDTTYNLTNYSWKDCIFLSSMLSLIFGSVLGLSQQRIKRLYAYSTISHVGFILLALCIDKIESISAYFFYIISYTLSNLNAFVILACMGYEIYLCGGKINTLKPLPGDKEKPTLAENQPDVEINDNEKDYYNSEKDENRTLLVNDIKISSLAHLDLKDLRYSPIQLISQIRGYFYINSYLALSLAITLFSFMGIPPLIGFFAKQMVLSAALDSGYIFITLIGIITSVIGAAYYLNIIKEMFFYKAIYEINYVKYFFAGKYQIKLNNPLSITISILTLIISIFMFIPNESVYLTKILSLALFI